MKHTIKSLNPRILVKGSDIFSVGVGSYLKINNCSCEADNRIYVDNVIVFIANIQNPPKSYPSASRMALIDLTFGEEWTTPKRIKDWTFEKLDIEEIRYFIK